METPAAGTHLQVSDGLAERFPLQHVVPGFLKHELTAGDGHDSDHQTLLLRNTHTGLTELRKEKVKCLLTCFCHLRQFIHQVVKPLVDFPEQSVRRQPHVLKEQLGRVL